MQGFNFLFAGSPGTGKTSVARLLGSLLSDLGVLNSGHLIEASRSTLVGGFIGQTALRTQKAVAAAMGGVLFVDEAHTLAQNGNLDFGREALQEIMMSMKRDRGKLAIVFATYDTMTASIFAIDPGFSRRISQSIRLEDFTDLELATILQDMAKARSIPITRDLAKLVGRTVGQLRGTPGYGNAGTIRQVFEQAKKARALRLITSSEQSGELGLRDGLAAFQPADFGLLSMAQTLQITLQRFMGRSSAN